MMQTWKDYLPGTFPRDGGNTVFITTEAEMDMPRAHENFHTADCERQISVADDEALNWYAPGGETAGCCEPCRERDKGSGLSFGKVANALSSGYESVYLVNLENDNYVEFSSQGRYKELSGTDFFADTLRNISRVVCEGDRERLASAMQKENLLQSTAGAEPFSILYRLMIGGKPLFYSLKAIRDDSGGQNHLIIGVRNVDDQIQNARRMGERSDFTPDFTGLAKAISRDIESIYYVDLEDDSYIEYRSDGAYGLREIETGGKNFFNNCQRDIQISVYSGDWEKVASAMDKENLLRTLRERESFSMDYRLLRDGRPLYYRLKVMPAEAGESFRHLIIGVSNVDRQITEEQRQSAERQNLESFARIAQALAQDYFIIYYVDVETDYFIEYSAEGKFLEHGIEKRGEDFFRLSRRNMRRFVYQEDLPAFRNVFSKENILREVNIHGSFAHTYRMVIDGVPRYVKMKVMRLDKRHIVLGTSDIDAQVRREQAQAQALQRVTELASRDALTGVKSKRVFVDAELTWDVKIEDGTAEPFAVAVFDLNGLKAVNDSQGHAAGDDYIRDACKFICLTFQHSPVYRIGGDEFAAILSGSDYARREELKEGFRTENANRHFPEKPVVACGMSDYRPGADSRFQDVFERADQDMYENKKELKCVR